MAGEEPSLEKKKTCRNTLDGSCVRTYSQWIKKKLNEVWSYDFMNNLLPTSLPHPHHNGGLILSLKVPVKQKAKI